MEELPEQNHQKGKHMLHNSSAQVYKELMNNYNYAQFLTNSGKGKTDYRVKSPERSSQRYAPQRDIGNYN